MSHTPSLIPRQPFSAGEWFEGSAARATLAPLRPLVDRLLALPTLERLYRSLPDDGRTFWDRALASLAVDYRLPEADAVNIPASGSVVVVANHPYGGLDGLVLASLMHRVRPDVKLLGNHLLSRIPDLRSSLFFVDPFGHSSSATENARALRSAIQWVKDGGALAVFPAGEVSHVRSSDGDGLMVDPPWSPAAARLARYAGAAVVPVFFHGANSWLFHLAGRVHPRLRTALLVRELLNHRHRTIAVRVGSPIPPARLKTFTNAEAMTAYLRVRTYALASADSQASERARGSRTPPSSRLQVADPEPVSAMAHEVAALGSSQVLCRSGAFTVCIAGACELPHTLREVGRLRETAFRAVGEGSGRERDLDTFDEHYLHLLVWNHERREVVGAYRVGQTDEILPRLGLGGLYTSTLFQYDRQLLSELGPALELGRAFVRSEYQRDYSPLLLLWKGIGTFVARHPRYRTLFGTVSISSDYQSLSQQILAKFLYATSYRPELGRFVTPRNPPRFLNDGRAVLPLAGTVARTIADVGALVAEIESDGKGVPVLLRQYLKLNARLLGFNVDRAFGVVLDGLMMVDLMDVEREMLIRYMGKPGALAFLAHHSPAIITRAS